MGYDSPENYSTASDLLKLTLQSIQNPTIKEFSSIKSTTVTSQNGSLKHILKNTNKELENFQQINGLKTGTTNIAGQCLITTTNNETPQISIILGSSNRFQDTKTMLDWAKNNIIYTNDPSNI
jgi:D-alanyl-D-alanine carboxypeptidase (penicillin-binding protein 5/6)